MVADVARGRIVLFGGCASGGGGGADTWAWDGTTWIERTPAHSPPARCDPQLAYDAHRDTWEWDGEDWIDNPGETAAACPGDCS